MGVNWEKLGENGVYTKNPKDPVFLFFPQIHKFGMLLSNGEQLKKGPH